MKEKNVALEEEIDEIEKELQKKKKRKTWDRSPSQTKSDSDIRRRERRSKSKLLVFPNVNPRGYIKETKGGCKIGA